MIPTHFLDLSHAEAEALLDRGDFYERDLYPLSNFSAFKLRWKGLIFDTSEHAYHWEKFNRDDAKCKYLQDFILRGTSSAHEAFKTAETNRDLRRRDWDDPTSNGRRVKVNVMGTILREKLRQHEYVRRKLEGALRSGVQISERSWRDPFWGTGPDGNGEDWMGRLWAEIAEEEFAP